MEQNGRPEAIGKRPRQPCSPIFTSDFGGISVIHKVYRKFDGLAVDKGM
jgi:hypothetical protein